MIGGGSNSAIGHVHEIALRMDHAYTLVGGCFSRNPAINMHSAMQYGLDANRVYDTPEALLKDMAHSVDAVVVATPIQDHAQHIQLSLQHQLFLINPCWPVLTNASSCLANSTMLKTAPRCFVFLITQATQRCAK
jgi:predicted dehydrogenase